MAASLNSSYSYILHDGNTVFTWSGGLATTLDQELAERQLDVIKVEFWNILFFVDLFFQLSTEPHL